MKGYETESIGVRTYMYVFVSTFPTYVYLKLIEPCDSRRFSIWFKIDFKNDFYSCMPSSGHKT